MALMRILRAAGIMLCAGAMLGASQCQKQDDQTDGSPVFITSLSLQDTSGNALSTFSTGQTIVLKLTVYNRSDSTQTLWFNTSELYNFAVVNLGTATTVWNWSANQTFTDSFKSLTFKPYETQTFTEDWDQTDNSGVQLATGQYEIFGGLTMYNTGGSNYAEDDADAMAPGTPTATQLTPTQYRSVLSLFTID
jgi:Intracellular proteinase inhibitor